MLFFPNSNSNLFSSHTLTWVLVLQFKLSIMIVFLISQPCLVYFYQISVTIYLKYPLLVKRLQAKITTYAYYRATLHSRVKLYITQNLDFCFSKIVESQSKWMYWSSTEIWRKSLGWDFQYFTSNTYFNY